MSRLNVNQIYNLSGSVPAISIPAFHAYRNTTQSITSATATPVQLNAVEFDTHSWFDATTNYRYTPQIAGYYQFQGSILIVASGSATRGICSVVKNGNIPFRGDYSNPHNATTWAGTASAVVYLNGTTDYVALSAYMQGTSPVIQGSSDIGVSYMSGFLVRAA